MGTPEEVAHKVDVLRGHCDAVGRDLGEIEVTTMLRNIPADPTVDDILRGAEAYAAVGVHTVMVGATGDDPAAWLETRFSPAIDKLKEIETK
jgi:hypothetical protein